MSLLLLLLLLLLLSGGGGPMCRDVRLAACDLSPLKGPSAASPRSHYPPPALSCQAM